MVSQKNNLDLTICSVFHNALTVRFLEKNYSFTEKINSRKNWVWLVANNSPRAFTGRVDPKKFHVVEGVRREDLLARHSQEMQRRNIINSFHHAAALNRWQKHVQTRFMLILDSDYYIVRPEWTREIIQYMKEKDLALFGSPWHPRNSKNYQYFPCHQSLFIDLEKVDLSSLNWDPIYVPPEEQPWYLRYRSHFPDWVQGRLSVGTGKDMSVLVYEALKDVVKYESVKPVITRGRNGGALSNVLQEIERNVLPERLLVLPKKKASYSTVSFRDLGYFDMDSLGGEEFMWKGKPFGFHVRRFKFSRPGRGNVIPDEEQLAILRDALAGF